MEAVLSLPTSKKHRSILPIELKIALVVFLFVPITALISPIFSIIFVYAFGLYLLFTSDYKFLLFFVSFIFIQNITLIICADSFDSTTNTIFSLSKEIMLYIFVFKRIVFGKDKRLFHVYSIFALVFIALLFLSFFTSDAEFFSKVLSIRQLLLPFVCLYFGVFLKIGKRNTRRFFMFLITLGLFSCVIGLLDLFVFQNEIWSNLPIEQYQINKGVENFDMYKGVPINYYTWDFNDLFHVIPRRLVSWFADPLTTAHFLFLCFMVVDYSPFKEKRLLKFLFFVCSILTLSKGIFIAYIVVFIFRLLRKLKYRSFVRLFVVLLIAGLIAIPVVVTIANKVAPNSSIVIHLNGFINGFTNLTIFGSGIGKSGVMVSAITDSERLTGESYIGVIASQLGILGLLSYAIFNIALTLRLYRRYCFKRNKRFLISIVLLLSLFAECFFSESAIGIVSTGSYFIIIGMTLSLKQYKQQKL